MTCTSEEGEASADGAGENIEIATMRPTAAKKGRRVVKLGIRRHGVGGVIFSWFIEESGVWREGANRNRR